MSGTSIAEYAGDFFTRAWEAGCGWRAFGVGAIVALVDGFGGRWKRFMDGV